MTEHNLELERERKFLEVLCREYTSVYCLDLSTGTIEPLKRYVCVRKSVMRRK